MIENDKDLYKRVALYFHIKILKEIVLHLLWKIMENNKGLAYKTKVFQNAKI